MAGRQDYRTPRVFLDAVENRFGGIGFDLAATKGHEVSAPLGEFGPMGYSPEEDSLTKPWNVSILAGQCVWLNPPFAHIDPWAEKLARECAHLRRWTLMLVPASVGSNWYREHLWNRTVVLGLSPRLTFVGEDAPYPKDLMLVCAGFGMHGFGTWRWDRPMKESGDE